MQQVAWNHQPSICGYSFDSWFALFRLVNRYEKGIANELRLVD